jgi:hypothetical protein
MDATAADEAAGGFADVDDTAEAPASEPRADAEAAAGGSDVASLQPVTATLGRRVIRTAELVLEVDDPGAAAEAVRDIAAQAGGFVATTDLTRDAEGVVRGTIVVRVPSDRLVDTVDRLDALATSVPVNRIDEVDVTTESADLEARLTNLTAYEAELRQLLADVRETTTRPDDLLTVFERIRSVRQEIDQLEARLAVLDDQVALSTVTVTLRPAAAAVPVTDPTWQPAATARAALGALARTMTGVVDATIWFVLAVLPVLLVLAVPVVAIVLGWRHHRRRSVDGRARGVRPAAPARLPRPRAAPGGTVEAVRRGSGIRPAGRAGDRVHPAGPAVPSRRSACQEAGPARRASECGDAMCWPW